MKLSSTEEEILEKLWVEQMENKKPFLHFDSLPESDRKSEAVKTLADIGHVSDRDKKIILLEEGKEYAKSIVRRHRLAERLLTDVVMVKEESVHNTSCQFEHIINKEVEENICILLGHPKFCPHGKPIPPGRCCVQSKWIVESNIKPLSALRQGQKGKVVYIHTSNESKLQKIMVLGILPGREITLLHNFPSIVFQIGFTQIAVDNEMADSIYILLEKNK